MEFFFVCLCTLPMGVDCFEHVLALGHCGVSHASQEPRLNQPLTLCMRVPSTGTRYWTKDLGTACILMRSARKGAHTRTK